MASKRRIGISCIVAGVLLFAGTSPGAVTTAEWKKGIALLNAGKNARAMAYGLKLQKSQPRDSFGYYLHYAAAERLARSGRADLWSVSARGAEVAARLQPKRDAVHLAHAIWCWWNAGEYASVVRISGPVIARGRRATGLHNWSLAWYYIISSRIKLGHKAKARELFAAAFKNLKDHPQVLHLSRLLSPMGVLDELDSSELTQWVERLLLPVTRHGKKAHVFLLEAAKIALRAGDAAYHSGDTRFALKLYSSPLRFRNLLAIHDGYLHDELRIRKIAATYRERRPGVVGKHKRFLKMLVVPESRLMVPPRKGAARTFNGSRRLRREAAGRMRRNFRIFADSILALTQGEIQWKWAGAIELKGAAITRTNLRYDPQYKRYIAQAFPLSIDPAPSRAVIKELAGADIVLLLWPGTTRPPKMFITNGGATEYPLFPGRRGMRGLIISEGDRRGRYGNSVLFFHHEFFHLLEWGYYDGTFPMSHGYTNRRAWPRDYRGRTEFDFYAETYLKRVLPRDRLRRMQWRQGGTHLYEKFLRRKKALGK